MNSEDDKRDKDGIAPDDVSFYTVDSRRLNTYETAERRLSQFQAPIFISQSNPHARLYVPAFDGTGNDEIKDPQHKTNVAKIHDQIKIENNPRIKSGYVSGPGTEDGWLARTRDGATGETYEPRLEEMYKLLINQAKQWIDEDPQAVISLADMGFSRGASQAAGFARMVEERGIQDPAAMHYTRDANNRIVGVTFDKNIPPLVPPGHVAQAEMLFDPVSTGAPMDYDRRPPPSVISGLQIFAEDEKRPAFKSDHIIDPGLSPDGRFLGVTVAGAHSDIGGGYHRDGLARRSENIAINYLNALSDTPFLQNVLESTDPRLNVVHRSEQGFPFDIDPRPHVNRDLPEGYTTRLVPQEVHTRFMQTSYGPVATETRSERPDVLDPSNAEPQNQALNALFKRHQPPPPPTAVAERPPQAPKLDATAAANSAHTPVGERVLAPEPPSLVAARAVAARDGNDVNVTLKTIERPDAPGQLKHPLPPSLAQQQADAMALENQRVPAPTDALATTASHRRHTVEFGARLKLNRAWNAAYA